MCIPILVTTHCEGGCFVFQGQEYDRQQIILSSPHRRKVGAVIRREVMEAIVFMLIGFVTGVSSLQDIKHLTSVYSFCARWFLFS